MQDSTPQAQTQPIPEPTYQQVAQSNAGQLMQPIASDSYESIPLARASEAIATVLPQTVNNPYARLNQIAAIKGAYVKDQFGV